MEGSDIQRLDFGKKGYGCKHYRRRCKIRAPCCNKIFPCRHCHNESTSMLSNSNDRHELVRHDVKQVICSVCDIEQQVAHICSNCGVKMGEYFCEVCNFYDDETEKGQFHCKDCGICRIGGRENFFHCQKCGSCYSVGLLDNHLCVENSMRHNCPICYEYLFDTLKNTTVLKCGHTMHLECFHEMTKHDRFGCPICSKSVFDLSKTWKRTNVEVMECFWWLKVAIFIYLFAVSGGTELKFKHKDRVPMYNHTLGTILVEYASAVYMSDMTQLFTWTCSRCDDMTEGFEIIELIVDVQNCLQAFVGVARDLNAIVIAFRGTQEHSIQNWIEDLFWKQLDLNYPDMPDAMVHHGFYYAYHNTTIRPCVLRAVKRAKELYGDLGIMVTGHSMGGAMASFCALDLTVNCEAQNVQLMTFGQPRIGNTYFASYFSQLVPNTIRVTNEHDIVPHLPPFYAYFPHKTYHHFPTEVWLHNLGLGTLMYTVETVCDSSGEDPSCSRSVTGNSISDHLVYYGVELQAETWGSCRIVMDPSVEEYTTTDLSGNFFMSKDPATSVLKLNSRKNLGSNSI